MKKSPLLFLVIIIFLTSLLGVFVVGSNVRAENIGECPSRKDKDGKDIANSYQCPPIDKLEKTEKYIRLQVAVPGVTDTCTKEIKEIGKEKPVKKTCHYIESNLPAYIKKLYSFTIGVIAIIAVIMIMIGGLKWIFAAGNPTRIGTAKQQITAAVAGLILALCSYVLLNAINPSLTKLTMTVPGSIETIEQGNLWCASFPYKHESGYDYVFYEQGHWGEKGYLEPSRSLTECGKNYQFGHAVPGGGVVETGQGQTCFGGECDIGVCYAELGFSFCDNPKDRCEDNTHADLCDEVNKNLNKISVNPEVLHNTCYKRNDSWRKVFNLGDNCDWDKILVCPDNWERVSCLSGKEFDRDNKAKGGCWKYDNKKKTPIHFDYERVNYSCDDNPNVNIKTSLVCCRQAGTDTPKLFGSSHVSGSFEYNVQTGNVTIDCINVSDCSGYSSTPNNSKEACERNICKISGTCKWQGGACKAIAK